MTNDNLGAAFPEATLFTAKPTDIVLVHDDGTGVTFADELEREQQDAGSYKSSLAFTCIHGENDGATSAAALKRARQEAESKHSGANAMITACVEYSDNRNSNKEFMCTHAP